MDYQKIGENIRKYRKMNGLSQEQLAEKINISVTHMSHIENGSAPQYFSESAAVKKAIVSISDSELPKWENIL